MDKYLGKRLDGRYELQEIVGVGGMAIVYKAYDNLENRIVAVKILKEEYTGNDEFLRRFINESKAISVLSHPNVVKVYDVSFGDLIQYIVMEYIDGITLKEYIEKSGPLSWNEAVQFTLQILRGLQHAHDKGVVHRDIKPQNIMVLPDGVIKVADFGIARFARSEQVTITDKAIGSVHYISPEQAKGEKTDEKADIYSVGVMLYEMITGKLPFQAESAVSVAIMQLQKDPTLPRDINGSIPLGLEQITMHAMQKDGVRRYKSASEMLFDLEAFKKNPAVTFDYDYFVDDSPTKFIPDVKGEEKKAEPKKKAKKAAGSPIIPILFGVTTTFVIALILIVLYFMGVFNTRVADIVVPDFLGMTREEIEAHEDADLFDIQYTNPDYSSIYDQNKVCKQEPEGGSTVKKNGKVTLTISLGPKNVPFPELYNQTEENAKKNLYNSGYTKDNIEIVVEPHSDVGVGTVITTSPLAGVMIAADRIATTKVTIYISSGPPEKLVDLPNLIGAHQDNAESTLKVNGLKLGTVTEEYSNSIPKGFVCGMTPEYSADAQVGQGTYVDIVISKGKMPPVQLTVNTPIYQSGDITISQAELRLKKGSKTYSSSEIIDFSQQDKYTFEDVSISELPQTFTLYYYDEVLGEEFKVGEIKVVSYSEAENGILYAVLEGDAEVEAAE